MTLSRGAWRCMSQGPHGCVQHCYLWRLRSSNTSSRRRDRDRDRDAGTELCVNELTGAGCSGVAGVARYCRVSDLSPLFYMDGRVCMRARCHQSPSTTDDAVARGCRPLTIYTRLTRTYRLGARLHILTAAAGLCCRGCRPLQQSLYRLRRPLRPSCFCSVTHERTDNPKT